jgi:HAD superfamily hydrolase (TIGR01509 family)
MLVPAPVRALIFDFDGVLADTEDLHCAAFDAVARTIGTACSRADYYGRYLGLPDRDCLAALCAQAGLAPQPAQLDDLLARKRAHFAALAAAAALYPGVADTLRRLHERFILAIASGAFGDEIDAILERQGVRALFTAVVGAEDVRAGKPAPEPFVQALRAINARLRPALVPAQCLVIEDSPRGIEAAHAAGMRCVGVTTNHDRAALAAADAIIAQVSELQWEAGTA